MHAFLEFVIDYCLSNQTLPTRDDDTAGLGISDDELLDLEDQHLAIRVVLSSDPLKDSAIVELINQPDMDAFKMQWRLLTLELDYAANRARDQTK
jgi:hypothetical protein|tara:strand:- start:4054 stop:4338 length:285 start_codon:yes stop_codon:yes gene_type:complete